MMLRPWLPVALVLGLVLPAVRILFAQVPDPTAFDVLIAGGMVVDGTGAPWYRADVGIRGDRLVQIGQLSGAAARTRIDAADLVVAPGFIDMLGQSEFNLLVEIGRAHV